MELDFVDLEAKITRSCPRSVRFAELPTRHTVLSRGWSRVEVEHVFEAHISFPLIQIQPQTSAHVRDHYRGDNSRAALIASVRIKASPTLYCLPRPIELTADLISLYFDGVNRISLLRFRDCWWTRISACSDCQWIEDSTGLSH